MIYTLIGAAIAAIVYLYIISSKPEAAAYKKSPEPVRSGQAPRVYTGDRFCPLCRSAMLPHEKLHVELYKAEPHDKVFILGCRECLPSMQWTRVQRAEEELVEIGCAEFPTLQEDPV